MRTASSQGLEARFEALQSTQVSKHARWCKNGKNSRPNAIITAGEYSRVLQLIIFQ
ncbi:hypothetical protein CPR19088_GLDEOEPO_00064 [Companilactobacillus paralimentarius]